MAATMVGKVALVTGGSSGIGRATALCFAREGAKVVVAARRSDEGEETAHLIQESGGEVIFVRADVSREAEVQERPGAGSLCGTSRWRRRRSHGI
jgi:NAD(P)-dependent dehydrogenase (short-subunit alcohol dehydrogenase family)